MAGYNPEAYISKKSFTGDVTVEYDPRYIKKRQKLTSTELAEKSSELKKDGATFGMSGMGAKQSKLGSFGAVSNQAKSDRVFALQTGIKSGKVKNLQQAVAVTNVSTGTVRSYLAELGYKLDENKNIIKG